MSDPTALRTLYPEIEAYRTGRLRVSPLHELYFEESGNPKGKPVVFLHGGPGSGTDPKQRRFFDPAHYRIVLFDQRGAGKSTPYASLEDNTTQNLVADMEALREYLAIDKWQVFGGSWGSTLALAYAETFPERVTELILRGIFLLRKSEIDWFYQEGAHNFYPAEWEQYLSVIPQSEQHDLVAAYYKRLTNEANPEAAKNAAIAWSVWEGSTSFLYQNKDYIARCGNEEFSKAFARIECHYFYNRGFFENDDQLLRDAKNITHIPTIIVQGRYDLPCPLRSAHDLHKALPNSTLKIVQNAGHSAFEPGILHELILATDTFRENTPAAIDETTKA